MILDLSEGEARVALVDQFPAGTCLTLFIVGDLGTLLAEAEVVRSHQAPDTGGAGAFEHGLWFLSRDPQLEQFVDLVTNPWKRFPAHF